MRKRIFWLVASAVLMIMFVAVTLLVKEDMLNRIDFDITHLIQNKLPRRLDAFLSSFSLIGSFEILAGVIFLVMLLRRKIVSFLVFVPFAAAHVIEIVGKYFVHHPGPPYMFFRYNIDFLFPSSYVQPGSSYPSGHSMRTVFVTFLFFHIILRSKMAAWMKYLFVALLLAFNGIMLVSRVSLGEHWTSDVIGGALLGASAAVFSFLLL